MLINLNTWFDLRLTCRSHGWVNLEPFEWFDESASLRWSSRIGEGYCIISVSQVNPTVLKVATIGHGDQAEVEQCVRRVLMLDWDASEAEKVAARFDHRVANMVKEGGGRLLRSSSAFEDVVKTVCTVNTSWRNTQSMVRRLMAFSTVGTFPTPQEILQVGVDGLRREAPVGYRASTIITIAEIARDVDLESVELSRLKDVRGLGAYATAHISVLRGDYSIIPVDSEVSSYCAQHLGIRKPDAKTVNDHFNAWEKYRFLGYKFGRMANLKNWIGD